MKNTETYRSKFESASDAEKYDASEYSKTSYSSLLWEIEKKQLEQILRKYVEKSENTKVLDFACGTGRVLSFIDGIGYKVFGVEISKAMVSRAKEKVPNAEIYCEDITTGSQGLSDRVYDVITAFRFLLNAEDDMRSSALSALVTRMSDDSILVINNHGNLFSHKIILWPVHAIKNILAGGSREGNYLTSSKMKTLFNENGLEVVECYGVGFFSIKITSRLSHEKAIALEEKVSKIPLLSKLCVNQMYVAKLKKQR